MRYVIANSTPLIALAKLDALINVGFWIGEDLYVEALRLSGELER